MTSMILTGAQAEPKTILLKTDKLGRIRIPDSKRKEILDEFGRSGLSGQAFAKLAGIKYPTFATWIQKHRRAAIPRSQPEKTQWVEVTPPEPLLKPQGISLQLGRLGAGARLEITSLDQVDLTVALLHKLQAKGQPC